MWLRLTSSTSERKGKGGRNFWWIYLATRKRRKPNASVLPSWVVAFYKQRHSPWKACFSFHHVSNLEGEVKTDGRHAPRANGAIGLLRSTCSMVTADASKEDRVSKTNLAWANCSYCTSKLNLHCNYIIMFLITVESFIIHVPSRAVRIVDYPMYIINASLYDRIRILLLEFSSCLVSHIAKMLLHAVLFF